MTVADLISGIQAAISAALITAYSILAVPTLRQVRPPGRQS